MDDTEMTAQGQSRDVSSSRAGFSGAMLVVAGGVLASRVLGLARDVVFAKTWGTGPAFAAFVIAFTVPNLLRALFGEGAFSAAFVPVFSETLERDGKEEAWRVAQRVVAALAAALTCLVGLAIVASLSTRALIESGGLALSPERRELAALTLRLLPWLMFYAVLICSVGALSGVLNCLNVFAAPALVPVVLNAALIATATLACPWWKDDARKMVVLSLGVLLAGFVQVGVLLRACGRQGMRLRISRLSLSPEVRRVAVLMAPALVGTGVAQINVVVDRLLSGYMGSAATTSLYYSQRLIYLPVGLFGVAMAVVCLPAMSRAWVRGDRQDMRGSLLLGLRQVLFFSLPATALLLVLRRPVVHLLFEWGTFGANSARETGWALLFYLPGVPAFVCAKVAVTPFYARQDTKTPVKIAAACLVLNVVLNVVLMQFLRQGGLALATTICSYLNVALLLAFIGRDQHLFRNSGMVRTIRGCVGASAVAALAASATSGLVSHWLLSDSLLNRILCVAAPVTVGGAAYLIAAAVFNLPDVLDALEAIRRRGSRGSDSPQEGPE